jgi:hypothetical protein
MVQITNRKKTIECLVTLNHNVWRTHGKNKTNIWSERADSLSVSGFIPRTGVWKGMEQSTFTLPEYKSVWLSGRKMTTPRSKHLPEKQVPMDDWLRFLGFYLSEGSIGCHGHLIGISQKKHKAEFGDVLKRLPFKVSTLKHGFQISCSQLASYCKQFGLSHEKFVPQFVKELSPRQIRIFLEAYGMGDGCFTKCGRRVFHTVSKRLADDVQELIFKCGDVANIRLGRSAGTSLTIGEKTYLRNHDSIKIEWGRQGDFWFETGKRSHRFIDRVPYDGMVHCVTVQNHIVYVRRNGSPFWSGNSPAGEVITQMFVNLPEILWFGAEGKLVDPVIEEPFGAQAIICSDWAMNNYLLVEYPDEIRPFVKLYNHCRVDAKDYFVPQLAKMKQIGSVIALGDSLESAVELCKKRAEQIKGFEVVCDTDAVDKAAADLEKI